MGTDKVKNGLWGILTLFVLVLTITLIFYIIPAISRYSDSFPAARTVSASGEGKVIVAPDTAITSFSVLSQGPSPEALTADNTRKMNAAIDFVKSQGVDPKDIKTTDYNLSPDYQYDKIRQRNEIVGYTLTQTVTIKIRDLGKVAGIIGGLAPLGINQMSGIQFSIDDQDKVLKDARDQAFAKARDKANEMASVNGAKLGKLLNISESNQPIYYSAMGGAANDSMRSLAAPMPAIQPGSQEVKVDVSLTYALQ